MKRISLENTLKKAEETRRKIEQQAEDETYQQQFDALYKEFADIRPKLIQLPAWRIMLEQSVRLYIEIERMWNEVHYLWNVDDNGRNEYRRWFKEIREAIRDLGLTLTRLGETFTSQPYIPVKDREVQSASELAKMQDKINTIRENMKKLEKKRERINPGGRREQKTGTLAENKEREKEKEKKQEQEQEYQ